MRNSSAPPNFQGGQGGPPQGMGPVGQMASRFTNMVGMNGPAGRYAAAKQGTHGEMQPWDQVPGMNWQQPGGGMPPPPAGAPPMSGGAPFSPEAYGEYRKLSAMPITGGNTRRLYNQAAMQFANQYGTGFDPRGVFAKTKALRRQYGTKG